MGMDEAARESIEALLNAHSVVLFIVFHCHGGGRSQEVAERYRHPVAVFTTRPNIII